ncbi:MAG: SGNH/GDSL hydrolase family protein [Erysipelotrichaceae bacterium]|nr:SGNH/GDSL hydrolase family protein [Erysipelotrichaceae bacterium]
MKKTNLLLSSLVILTLCACNNNVVDESSIDSSLENESSSVEESSSIEESSSVEESSSIEEFIDESKYQLDHFIDTNDLYLLPGESYYLNKMIVEEEKYTSLTYLLKENPFLSVSATGCLTSSDNEVASIETNVVYVIDENTSRLQKINVNVVNKEEYGNYFMSVDLGRLYHKKVIFFGDSITHSWLRCPSGSRLPDNATQEEINEWNKVWNTGSPLGYNTHYLSLLNNKCQFESVVNAAWSGGTMSYLPTSKERFVYKSFPGAVLEHENDIKNAEYAFVFYGTNDLTDQVKIGKISDNVDINSKVSSSFMGGMNFGIQKLQEYNENIKIVFMNLLTRTYAYSGDYTLQDYNDAIEEIALSYSLKVLDVNSIFDPSNFYNTYSNDGLHPNDAGYALIADYILKYKG